MFVTLGQKDDGSLREERHVERACTLHSYGAAFSLHSQAINILLLRSQDRRVKYVSAGI